MSADLLTKATRQGKARSAECLALGAPYGLPGKNRARGARHSALKAILATSLLTFTCTFSRADGFDPFGLAAGNSTMVEEGPMKAPRLYWKNDESLEGKLVEADGQALSWKADIFSEPVKVRLSSLLRVEQPQVKASSPTLTHFSIILKSGDRVYANVSAITPEGIVMESPRHGTLKIPLGSIQSIDRLRGDGIIYSGPTGPAGWQQVSGAQQARKDVAWFPGERGAMTSRTWNRTIKMDMPSPDKVQIDIVLSSPLRPSFSLAFSANRSTSPAIETWQDELVVADQSIFAPLQTLEEKDHTVALRIQWDRTAKVMKIHNWAGELIREFNPGHNDPENMGLYLRNKGAELTLERVNVRAWDGSPCAKYDAKLGWVRRHNGSTLQGALTSGANGVTVTPPNGAPETVALADIASLDAGPQAENEKLKTGKDLPTRIRYADGTLLTGSLVQIKDGSALMRLAGLTEPVQTKIADMTRLALNEPAPLSEPPEKPMGKLDVLHTGATYLHGTLEGAGDVNLRWRTVGGLEPTAINPAMKDLEIHRQITGLVEKPPALFFTVDDNVLGGTLQGIDADGARLTSEIADVKVIKNSDLRAVHFNAPKSAVEGFADPGWQIVKGDQKQASVKGEMLVLNDGGAFGHPSIMSGDEITFTMSVPGTWGALAVELFTADMESRSRAMRLHLIYSGADFWAVMEDTENNSRSSEQLRNLARKDINLRLAFDESSMLLYANDMMVLSSPLPANKREGSGLVFTTSNMWGNTGRDVQVSNVKVHARPDYLQVPAVPAEARRQALIIPRFRRESPPTHALLAPNADLLRGKIDSANGQKISFISGSETAEIPTSRVTAAIWLTKAVPLPDAPGSAKKTSDNGMDRLAGAVAGFIGGGDPPPIKVPDPFPEQPPAAPKPPPPPAPTRVAFSPTHWLVLQDGSRLALKVERFERDALVASAPLLGNCRIPLSHLSLLRLSPMPPTNAMQAYRDWQLEYAPEPVLPETGGESSPLLNKPAPPVTLPLLGGGQFDLNAEKGKVVILDFWATWCGPCVASMPENLKVMSQFDPNKVKFVAVNQGEPDAQVSKFLQTRGWQMIVAMDANQAVGAKYGADTIPHTVIIGPDGKVAWTHSGFTAGGAEKMAGVVKRLLGGE